MCRRIIYFILQLLTATAGWSMVWMSLTLTLLGNQILRVEGTVFLFIIEANRCDDVLEFLNGFCNGSGWFLYSLQGGYYMWVKMLNIDSCINTKSDATIPSRTCSQAAQLNILWYNSPPKRHRARQKAALTLRQLRSVVSWLMIAVIILQAWMIYVLKMKWFCCCISIKDIATQLFLKVAFI